MQPLQAFSPCPTELELLLWTKHGGTVSGRALFFPWDIQASTHLKSPDSFSSPNGGLVYPGSNENVVVNSKHRILGKLHLQLV